LERAKIEHHDIVGLVHYVWEKSFIWVIAITIEHQWYKDLIDNKESKEKKL
jgi:hypothetical protein